MGHGLVSSAGRLFHRAHLSGTRRRGQLSLGHQGRRRSGIPSGSGRSPPAVQLRRERGRDHRPGRRARHRVSVRLAGGFRRGRDRRACVADFLATLYEVPERQKRLARGGARLDPQRPRTRTTPKTRATVSWRRLLRYRQAWSFIVGKVPDRSGVVVLPDLAAGLLQDARGLDIKTQLLRSGDASIRSSRCSASSGGWVTGFLTRRGWTVTRARKTGMFVFALCVVPIFFVTQASDWGAVILIGLGGRGAPGVVGQHLHDRLGHVPEADGGIGGRLRRNGRLHRRDALPDLHRASARPFKSVGNITAGYTILFAMCGSAYWSPSWSITCSRRDSNRWCRRGPRSDFCLKSCSPANGVDDAYPHRKSFLNSPGKTGLLS